MNVALITTDGPLAHFRKLTAPILNARVVARLLDLRMKLEVLQHATAPDEELVILQRLRPLRLPRQGAVFDGPQLRIAVPTREVLAVEERFEAVLGEGRSQNEE